MKTITYVLLTTITAYLVYVEYNKSTTTGNRPPKLPGLFNGQWIGDWRWNTDGIVSHWVQAIS